MRNLDSSFYPSLCLTQHRILCHLEYMRKIIILDLNFWLFFYGLHTLVNIHLLTTLMNFAQLTIGSFPLIDRLCTIFFSHVLSTLYKCTVSYIYKHALWAFKIHIKFVKFIHCTALNIVLLTYVIHYSYQLLTINWLKLYLLTVKKWLVIVIDLIPSNFI